MIDPKNLKDVCAVLKEYGVTYFKSGDMELMLSKSDAVVKPVVATPVTSASNPLVDAPEDIKHKVEELTSIMKMGDVELIDRLFPEPIQDEGE